MAACARLYRPAMATPGGHDMASTTATTGGRLGRQIAAALALLGVLLHGGLSGRHAAALGPVGPLVALGAICFANGSSPSDQEDNTAGDMQRNCPICTALAATNLAPPAGDTLIEPPDVTTEPNLQSTLSALSGL